MMKKPEKVRKYILINILELQEILEKNREERKKAMESGEGRGRGRGRGGRGRGGGGGLE